MNFEFCCVKVTRFQVKLGQIQYFTKPESSCSLKVLAFSSAVMLGFYAMISSVFSSCKISWIHFSFPFTSAARFFFVYHRKISSNFFTSFDFVRAPYPPDPPPFSLLGLPLPVLASTYLQ
jgi:hypothetical protein